MRDRLEILKDLIALNGSVKELQRELTEYPFDSELELVKVTSENVVSILSQCVTGQYDAFILEDWANALECRDDVGFENEIVKESIHEIANAVLHGGITDTRLTEIISELENQKN